MHDHSINNSTFENIRSPEKPTKTKAPAMVYRINIHIQHNSLNHGTWENKLTKKKEIFLCTGSERGFKGLDDVSHGLINGGHFGLGVETSHDGVETRSEAEIIHLFGALADGVLGVDSGAVHVAFLDGLFHLQFLGFLFLLAFSRLALKRF